MNKQILYLLFLLGLFAFAACTNEAPPLTDEGTGEIRFAVIDTTDVEISTKSSFYFDEDDIKEFRVSLKRGDTPVFTNRRYGEIVGTSFTCKLYGSRSGKRRKRMGTSPCVRTRDFCRSHR